MEEFALHVMNVLKQHYGISRYHDAYPSLDIERYDGALTGEYRDDYNGIVLYLDAVLDLANEEGIDPYEAIVITLTHEYIHYLQSPRWMKRYYTMGHNYFTHPYEVEAFSRERELLPQFNLA